MAVALHDSKNAIGVATAALAAGESREVRKQAVFALSQSDDEVAIDALITIARTHRNSEVVRTARSGSRRAVMSGRCWAYSSGFSWGGA